MLQARPGALTSLEWLTHSVMYTRSRLGWWLRMRYRGNSLLAPSLPGGVNEAGMGGRLLRCRYMLRFFGRSRFDSQHLAGGLLVLLYPPSQSSLSTITLV